MPHLKMTWCCTVLSWDGMPTLVYYRRRKSWNQDHNFIRKYQSQDFAISSWDEMLFYAILFWDNMETFIYLLLLHPEKMTENGDASTHIHKNCFTAPAGAEVLFFLQWSI